MLILHHHYHDYHQAGFKIGMSDGGLVTEAKPSIQWDKVGQYHPIITIMKIILIIIIMIIILMIMAGQRINPHLEIGVWSCLERQNPDHLCWRRSH